jgi:hypothetical protein
VFPARAESAGAVPSPPDVVDASPGPGGCFEAAEAGGRWRLRAAISEEHAERVSRGTKRSEMRARVIGILQCLGGSA